MWTRTLGATPQSQRLTWWSESATLQYSYISHEFECCYHIHHPIHPPLLWPFSKRKAGTGLGKGKANNSRVGCKVGRGSQTSTSPSSLCWCPKAKCQLLLLLPASFCQSINLEAQTLPLPASTTTTTENKLNSTPDVGFFLTQGWELQLIDSLGSDM